MNKPIKPEITIPQSFAENGVKTDFDDTLLADGFDNLRPDVLAGDNLNKFIDDTYKGLNYGMAAADALNLINEGETLIVRNGEFTSGAAGGGGLEIGDIGIAPLGIDETKGKRRYLNGQLIIQEQYVQFTDKVKSAVALYPTLACTEDEWQTTSTMTVCGQVGKFVVDDEAGTIRLPKIIMPIQGLTDLSKLAEIVEAGLPNITGYLLGNPKTEFGSASGAFKLGTTRGGNTANYINGQYCNVKFDASLSNPIYGNSDTVQQEQIQYPYFIQVATGAETEDNIINEIELNNPFSLLDYKYSEYELNNLSWLRSNGQYNSKAIYPAVYDLLLKIYNGTETKAGVSVKLHTDTSATEYDFRINTADETFMLPIKVKLASGKAIVGNGMALGLTTNLNAGGVEYLHTATQASKHLLGSGLNNTPLSTGSVIVGNGVDTDRAYGVSINPDLSGIETSSLDLYLYFYVGETVQNANLINAGRIEEIKANRSELDGNIVLKPVSIDCGTTPKSGEIITISLEDYLPKDDNIYEVLVSGGGACEYSGWIYIYIGSDLIENGPDKDGLPFMRVTSFSTTRAGQTAGNVTIPVGKGRYITLYNTPSGNTPRSIAIDLACYRKVR